MRLHLICVLCGLVATHAQSQGLGEKVFGGIRKGAQAVGDGASNVAQAVDNSVTSTKDLFSSDENPDETRARLDATTEQSISRLFAEQPEAHELYDTSAGFAVFDVRKVSLAGFSGGAGQGVAVDRSNRQRTYMNMTTGGVGLALGIGGFESQLVILFEDNASFGRFATQGFDASANAGSMFGDDESVLEIEFRDGRAVFALTKKGWRIAASATGSSFWPDPDLN